MEDYSVSHRIGILAVMMAWALPLALGEAQPAEKPPAKAEITGAQREAILRARLKVTETLSQVNEIKVQAQERIETLQKQSTQEFQQYQRLVEAAGKACTADETFDPDAIACKPKVQAKAKETK